tara:strand:+ start:9110 stop:9760 length:651 start_codon:yes stop_codon:yes gene_type:complete
MVLNYNTIINYLAESSNNDFPTSYNTVKYDFTKFKDYFNSSFYRYGVLVNDNSYKNISLVSSILYCSDDKFNILNKKEQLSHISKIMKTLENDIHEVLKVNLVYFNFENEEITYDLYSEKNLYRPTILLAKYKDYYEPICNSSKKLFSFHDDIIKKLPNLDGLECENKIFFENKLTLSKLKKMKKDEILTILQNKNININLEKPKKQDLIDLYLQN